jgi:hypothetical protein
LFLSKFIYCTKNGTLISSGFVPLQLANIGITKVDVVFFTIAAFVEVVASITVLPPELVHPNGAVTALWFTPPASLIYPRAYDHDLNPPKLLLK